MQYATSGKLCANKAVQAYFYESGSTEDHQHWFLILVVLSAPCAAFLQSTVKILSNLSRGEDLERVVFTRHLSVVFSSGSCGPHLCCSNNTKDEKPFLIRRRKSSPKLAEVAVDQIVVIKTDSQNFTRPHYVHWKFQWLRVLLLKKYRTVRKDLDWISCFYSEFKTLNAHIIFCHEISHDKTC